MKCFFVVTKIVLNYEGGLVDDPDGIAGVGNLPTALLGRVQMLSFQFGSPQARYPTEYPSSLLMVLLQRPCATGSKRVGASVLMTIRKREKWRR